ncbi:MAG: glutamate 5-kinase [Alphaproteobacteria bacterium]|nr:glutamate 5-kinase [Alphaproteobacteria bacterium]
MTPATRVHETRTPAAVLGSARRIVVKVGSSLLVDRESNRLRADWLAALASDISGLRDKGAEVVIVSSGAIALGRRGLDLPPGVLRLEESQAAAAAGQIELASAYRSALDNHGIRVAQILLTLSETEERRRHLNARATLRTLLDLGVVPVVNENDTVATNEIRFGDNDRLGARVTQMISADCLVLLSDIDGLYSADPRRDPAAEHIGLIERLTPEIEAMAGKVGPKTAYAMGSGGMQTKLIAARIAVGAGAHMIIADGRQSHPLGRLLAGARASVFLAEAAPRTARKHWIAASLSPAGHFVIDEGAVRALRRGMSLLPAGVVEVQGSFERGDAVRVLDRAGQEVGRGLTAYDSEDAGAIMGLKSRDIEDRLGYRGRDEMIHRDDLVVTAADDTGARKDQDG